MMGRLRRMRWTNCPIPIEAVSPSPLTPRAMRSRLASMAPVATEGMRPWTALKLCERLMKYAGLFDEQPMPLGLMTRSGGMPISYMASMMRSEMALWPHPAQSVVLPPLYSRTERPMRLVLGAGAVGVVAILLALHGHEFVGHRARVERQAVDMRDAAQASGQRGLDVELEQAEHLGVAVLLDDVDGVVLLDEVVHLAGEGVGANAQVVGLDPVLVAQLVAALDESPVRGAVADDADLRFSGVDFRARHEGARGFELAVQPLHVVLEVIGALAVLGPLVVSAAAREVGGGRVIGPGESAVPDAITVNVFVAGESAEPVEVFLAQHLATPEGLLGILEGIGHPVVHAEIEVGHDEHQRLELLGEIEGVLRHGEAFLDGGRNQKNVLGIAMGEKGVEKNVALRGARGQPGGRTDPLDVPDDAGDFGVVGKPGEFGHERDAGAGGGGHSPRARPSRANDHADCREFVFRLHDGEGGFAVGSDAVFLHVVDKRFGQRR